MAVRRRPLVTAFAYDKRGRLLATGHNSYTKTHPVQAMYAARAGRPDAPFLHAEIDALLKTRERVHRLLVVRLDAKGNPALAAPCPICQLAIHDWGVKQVEYT